MQNMQLIAKKGNLKMNLKDNKNNHLKISIKRLSNDLDQYFGDSVFKDTAARKELAMTILNAITNGNLQDLTKINDIHNKYAGQKTSNSDEHTKNAMTLFDDIKVAYDPEGARKTNKKHLHNLRHNNYLQEIAKEIVKNISLDNEPETYEEQYQDVKAQISYDERLYTIADLFEFAEKHLIKADPDMNTEHVITDDNYSSQVIESVLMGYPLPALYFLEKQDGSFLIIDGIVRLYALVKFIRNDFKLVNLQYLSKMNGKQFKDLAPEIQDEFKSRPIKVMVFTKLDQEKAMDLRDRLQ